MNYQPRDITDQAIQGPASYASEVAAAKALLERRPTWNGVTAEAVARMRLQNRFKTGLDIARYTAALMRSDMAAYDADPTKYTQSLGCWHGFIAQQKLISVKKHFGKTDRRSLSDTATSTSHQCDTAFEMQAACHEYFPKKSRSFNPWSEQRVGLTINLPRKII